MTFALTPRILAGGDDVPLGASIVVTDNLPGTTTDFSLTNVNRSGGLAPSCTATATANTSRTLVCTYNGPFTIAQLNASTITLTGTAGNNGSFLNTASVVSGSVNYFDAELSNNTADVSYVVDPGTDIQALGAFPSAAQVVGTPQTLAITYKNNGPLASSAGGVVETIVPTTFTIGTLPAGCVATPGQSLTITPNTYSGTLVRCTAAAVAVGASQGFSIPLTMPAAPEASSFPVIATPPPGLGDANLGNNSLLLPYQIVQPFADLSASKSKTPTGPQPPGTVVTNTLTIKNEGTSTDPATYSGTQPLRIVDFVRPEEVDGGTISDVTAGWTCNVATGVTPPGFGGDLARTTRIACENPGPGTLAPNASVSVSFKSTIGIVLTPITLSNRACTGSRALEALGLLDTNGPQPPDGGRTTNDCADAGTGLVATPVTSGLAQVSIKKESSVDGSTYFDLVEAAPTLAGAASPLYWRMTITTPSDNATQETIPTLRLTDTLPGILNVTSTGSPAPSFKTPAITVTTTPDTYGICPNIAAGNNALTCDFTNVPPGTTITVDIPVSRALNGGLLTNTGTLTSPNAILSAPAGGKLNDNAAVNVTPQVDIALTTKTVTPATPTVGEVIQFAITAQNLGGAHIAGAGQFTMTDTFFTGTPTLGAPAYEVLSATPANAAKMSCAASNLAAGTVSCTNLVQINRYETQTINIKVRVKKPSGLVGAANSVLYTGVVNTASVVLDLSYCEFKTETVTNALVSGACNDLASRANNEKSVTFDIKVPAIDLQQGKVSVFPAGQTRFLVGDQLRYRFSIRNAGPSRAENVVMTDILTVPTGFTVTLAAAMPDKINLAAPNAGYTAVAKPVVCTQAGADANVICKLDPIVANNYLDAGQEVNFEIALDAAGTATGPVIFGNAANVCADETNTYESSGKCSPDPTLAGNNIASVNNVLFPRADLEVVSKTAVTPSPLDVAQPIQYDIVLRNNGTATTPKMRLVDTLPTGFEWIHSGIQAPKVVATGGSAATLTAAGGLLTVAASVPANGTENVCFISNGITNVTTLAQQQAITCDISGSFPAGVANTITLTLHARAIPGLYNGAAGAPYLTNRTNTARIFPGKNASGEDVAVDDNPSNNEKTTTVQVQNAQVGGRVFLDLNNNGDQNGETLTTDQGIGGVTITLTGTDKYGNPVSRTMTTSSVAAGAGSLRGSYLFENLAPSDAAGYTITQAQPAEYGNGLPQPNTPRVIRNGVSTGTSASGGAYASSNTATTSVIGGVVLAGGGNGVQFDFPETQKPYLSGFVYLDANNDGIKDAGEAGINGVTMTLIGCRAGPNGVLDTSGPIGAGPAACSGDDVAVNRTIVTDGNGQYLFALDEPGRYSVIQQTAQPVVAGVATLRGKTTAGSVDLITSPVGTNNGGTRGTVNATGSNVGGNAGVLQEVNAAVAASQLRDIVINNSAAISVNNNFGEVTPASVAGVVFTEKGVLNSNYQPGVDWPLPGAKLVLTGTDDLGQAVTATITTPTDGSYAFNQLRPGTYMVVKTNPAPSIINEVKGAFPGKDAGNTVRGTYVDENTISTIEVVSGTKVTQTNFAVTNGPPPFVPANPPLLKLFKGHTGEVKAGAPAVYTLTVTNTGGSPTVGALQLSDLLPVGMTLVAANPITSASGTVTNVAVVGQAVSFDLNPTAPLNAGNSLIIKVNVDVSATASGTLINYAAVSGGGDPFVKTPPGPNCVDSDHCSQDPVTLVDPLKPNLKLVKTHTGDVKAGAPASYTLTVTNKGSSPTVGALQLSDLLPVGMTLVAANPITSASGTITNVAVVGQAVSFDLNPTAPLNAGNSLIIKVNVDVSATASGTLINYAVVSGGGDPFVKTPPGPNCVDSDHCSQDPVTLVKPNPKLKLVKSHSGALAVGKVGIYTLSVTNNGGVASQGVLHLSDLLPNGMGLVASNPIASASGVVSNVVANGQLVKFDFTPASPIAVGQSVSLTVSVNVGPAAVGSVVNYASVSGGDDPFVDAPPGPGCVDADHCSNDPTEVIAAKPELKLVKSHSGSMTVGHTGIYTLVVSNVSGSPTVGALHLSDLLPNGMSLVASNPIASASGVVANVVANGQLVKFDFTPASPIVVGQSVSLTVSVNVGPAAVGSVVNYASVSGGDDPFVDVPPGPGCVDANHCSNDPTEVKGPPVLSLVKTAPAAMGMGGNGEYVLTIKNSGESPTSGVLHLIEKLPPGLNLNGQISSVDGVVSNLVSSGNVADGLLVKFDFMPNQPLVEVAGSAAITVPVTVGATTVVGVITNYASVGGGGDIRDDGNPPTPGSDCADTRCANAPSTVAGAGLLSITKTVSKTEAELGDMVSYTVTIANIGTSPVPQPDIVDRLPAGFRLLENTSRVTGAVLLQLQGAPGPVLTYTLDVIQPGKSVTITYRVRLGVGAMQGDGVNRVKAQCRFNSDPNCSNEARARVRVTGGVFTNDACVVGMVYVDCNGNQVKDREELGIPGVRLYVEDGTFLISDSEGKYSFCGLSPKTHVLKVDQVTLPRGSRLVSSSNRNVGDANSLFLDLKNGELQRADFIEGSCSNTVLEQVKARRTLGEITGPQTEKKGGAALTFEGRAPNYPQQGTDSANQVIVKPRIDSAAGMDKPPVPHTQSERDTPLQQLELNQGDRRAH